MQQASFLADYAVGIFHDALTTGHPECYLRPDTRLPMMYIDDCIRSIVTFLTVPRDQLTLRCRTKPVSAL